MCIQMALLNQWYFMVLLISIWYYMVFSGIAYVNGTIQGIRWYCMLFNVYHVVLIGSIMLHGIQWYYNCVHGNTC